MPEDTFCLASRSICGTENNKGGMKIRKKKQKQKQSTLELINLKELSDYSVLTQTRGELVYFLIKADNLSVLSCENIAAKVYSLMTVLKGITEIELMCMNSRESYETNKRYLRKRVMEEDTPVIRALLERDLTHLDTIQVEMATAREFLLILRLKPEDQKDVHSFLNRIERTLHEQGFEAQRASVNEMKRLLAVYFEQDITQDTYQSVDGERWVIADA